MADDGDDRDRPRGLSAADAAARLGIKRQTLYAYVSRGLLKREVAPDGRSSLFDPGEIEQLRLGRRPDTEGELHALIATGLTRIDDHGIWLRGRDLVAMVGDGATFTEVVDELWGSPDGESWEHEVTGDRRSPSVALGAPAAPLLDELRVIVAECSAHDALRHDLSPKSVRAVGRRLIVALATGLPARSGASDAPDRTVAAALWRRLSPLPPDDPRLQSLDAAMSLLVDHGLASSTFAARVAASVRADPYSVVGAGLGVMGGTLHGAASASVHELLTETERTGDATSAAGEARRRLGGFPGFGHAVYTIQDPRYGALMARIIDAWGDDPRLVNVYRVRDVIGERTDAIPNVDLALGALTYLADMPVAGGEVIFSVARTAGWLAHAMEEYEEKPLRFRPRAKYVGPRPS
ncbi:MAG: citrate synthase [Acidimicrobiia bacterium]|nr:citrate synthase [Acidimicrobiia bacterium]